MTLRWWADGMLSENILFTWSKPWKCWEKKLRCERSAIFAKNNINHQLQNLQASQGPLLIFLPVSPITVAALLASTKAGIPHTLVSSNHDFFVIWLFSRGLDGGGLKAQCIIKSKINAKAWTSPTLLTRSLFQRLRWFDHFRWQQASPFPPWKRWEEIIFSQFCFQTFGHFSAQTRC